jgi:proteasome lid subunit RPN8/RPN11
MIASNGVSKVVFDSRALTTIRNAVAEAYPKESFGILYGNVEDRGLVVRHVQVMQKVNSTSNSVTPNIRAKKRIDRLMDLDKMHELGSYHSHPKTHYPYLSKTDAGKWNLLDETVQVVVSANITRFSARKWYKLDDNTLATRILCDNPLSLRLKCYTRRIKTPLGYVMLHIGRKNRAP